MITFLNIPAPACQLRKYYLVTIPVKSPVKILKCCIFRSVHSETLLHLKASLVSSMIYLHCKMLEITVSFSGSRCTAYLLTDASPFSLHISNRVSFGNKSYYCKWFLLQTIILLNVRDLPSIFFLNP